MTIEKSRLDYLRVTNVLWPFSGLDKINPDVLKNAAERGTKVHHICEGIMLGLGELGVDDQTWGYIESFKKWWGEGRHINCIERRFYDDFHKITGMCDMIMHTSDGLAIVDLKTSSKESKTWAIQGAAYAYLASLEGFEIQKILFIHLNKHGKEPKIYEYPVDDEAFLSVLRTYNHFYKEKS